LNKELFSHVDGGRTRQDADPLNLKQKPARLEIRRNFFTQRVVKKWNAIPSDVKRAKNVKMFKMHYKKTAQERTRWKARGEQDAK
jgi:hypothetical protein